MSYLNPVYWMAKSFHSETDRDQYKLDGEAPPEWASTKLLRDSVYRACQEHGSVGDFAPATLDEMVKSVKSSHLTTPAPDQWDWNVVAFPEKAQESMRFIAKTIAGGIIPIVWNVSKLKNQDKPIWGTSIFKQIHFALTDPETKRSMRTIHKTRWLFPSRVARNELFEGWATGLALGQISGTVSYKEFTVERHNTFNSHVNDFFEALELDAGQQTELATLAANHEMFEFVERVIGMCVNK